jgi:uncharacterized protein YndB with AHSA1/START domain
MVDQEGAMNENQIVTQLPGDDSVLRLRAEFPNIKSEELFTYFTQPELLVKWWPQTAELEPHEAGRYTFTWPSMNWSLSGEYAAFEPGRRLEFTWQWEHEPKTPMRRVEIDFSDTALGSEIILTHGPYSRVEGDQADRDQADRLSHLEGWNHFLSRLGSVLTQG